MNNTPKLRTENLTRTVGDKMVVDGISVEVPSRKCTAVAGPSGAGKTSFLRLLNRLDEPTEGTVYLDGNDYRELNVRELRKRIGMVPQEPSLLEGTVRENLELGPKLREEKMPEDHLDTLVDRMEITSLTERDVETLSAGEAQRVAIGRALVNHPEVLLLDEPTAHLDDRVEREVEKMLEDLMNTFDLTVVLVTHSKEQAGRLAGRVLLMRNGRLETSGPPSVLS